MSTGTGLKEPPDLAREEPLDELAFVRIDGRPLYAEELDLLALVVRGMTDRLLPPLARTAASVTEQSAWKEFGYARAEDFCRERLARSGRWLRRLAAIGRAFGEMPELARAAAGDDGLPPLGQEQVYQVARIARPETVAAWIAFARRVSLRDLRREVRSALAEGREAAPGADPARASSEGRDSGAESRDADDADRLEENGAEGGPGAGGDGDAARGAAEGGDTGSEGDADDDDGDEDARLVTLRLFVPGPVRAAWEEVFDLHRAVNGGGGVTAFVEALVAEAWAAAPEPGASDGNGDAEDGDGAAPERDPLDGYVRRRPRPGRPSRARWRQPAEPNWEDDVETWIDRRHLEEILGWGPSLLRVAGTTDAVTAVRELERLLAVEERAQRILGEVLFLLAIQWGFFQLGFERLERYAEERLGMSGAAARERVQIARGLRWRPLWRKAWIEGRISAQKMLILLRAFRHQPLDDDAEAAWLVLAEGVTCRRLRDEVRIAQEASWLRIDPERRGSRRPCDDRAWRRALHRGYGRTVARLLEALDSYAHSPFEDTLLALRIPRDLARDFVQAVERMETPDVLQERLAQFPVPDLRGDGEEAAPGDGEAWTFSAPWIFRSPSWKLFCLLFTCALEWDRAPMGLRRAEQAVYERDGWRCQAPGCSSQRNLEAHHIVYRARGGADVASNLLTLCRFHHQRGEHGGLLRVTGEAPDEVTYRLGRDGIGGTFRNDWRIASPAARSVYFAGSA